MCQVMFHQGYDALFNLVGSSYASQKCFRHWSPLLLVTWRYNPHLSVTFGLVRGLRFGEIMSQDGKHQDLPSSYIRRSPFREIRQRVTVMTSVDENIAFRMPLRILRRAIQCGDFRKVSHPASVLQKH